MNKLKINNSRESAVNGKWSNPGSPLFNKLSSYTNKKELLDEAYLSYNSDGENYTQSECKYPHHVIKDDELVLSIPGVKAAYSRACQMNIFKGELKSHLIRHIKELGIEEHFHFNESVDDIIENNFDYMMEYLSRYYKMMKDSIDSDNVIKNKLEYLSENYLDANNIDYYEYDNNIKKIKKGLNEIEGIAEGFLGLSSPDDKYKEMKFSEIETPYDLQRWMDFNIKYGWWNNGYIDTDVDNPNMGKYYRLQSPSITQMRGCGICSDQVELERFWFNSKNIKNAVIYIELDIDYSTPAHTFLLYKDEEKNSYCWFEHSWSKERGIHFEYNNVSDLIKNVVNKHVNGYQNGSDLKLTITHLKNTPRFDITMDEYVEWARSQPSIDIFNDNNDLFEECVTIYYEEDYYTEKDKNVIKNLARSPEELVDWMNKNIRYDNSKKWKLKTPMEMYATKIGNCHDQALFEMVALKGMGLKCNRLFFVEFSKYGDEGGDTHTLTWYKKDGKIYWIENAWGDKKGIHGPYDSIDNLKESVLDIYRSYKSKTMKYDGLVFSTTNNVKPGMNLKEYVEHWKLEDDRLFESANSIKYFKDIDTVDGLSEFMKSIKYGWKKKKNDLNIEKSQIFNKDNVPKGFIEFYNTYYLQTPDELLRSREGNCWDQVELERNWFKDNGYKFQIIYSELLNGKENPSHTFLIFKDNDEYKWFENAWPGNEGIHSFKSLRLLLDRIIELHRKQNKDYESEVVFYKLSKPNYGINCEEYTIFARKCKKIDVRDISDRIFTESNKGVIYMMEEESIENVNDEEPDMNEENEDKNNEETVDDTEVDTNEELEEQDEEEVSIQPKSLPKQADQEEVKKNGVRRKKLYIAFIEWAKAYNDKNTFGSVFDKDAFNVTYPFVPHEMRYFYRLSNPLLCVLSGDLTFFALSELQKINSVNKKLDEMLIFAATPNDYRIFSNVDKKVYLAKMKGDEIILTRALASTFDMYIQTMIDQGDILNGPIQESFEMFNNYLKSIRDKF